MSVSSAAFAPIVFPVFGRSGLLAVFLFRYFHLDEGFVFQRHPQRFVAAADPQLKHFSFVHRACLARWGDAACGELQMLFERRDERCEHRAVFLLFLILVVETLRLSLVESGAEIVDYTVHLLG